jgi:hypothetical protein
VFGRLCLLLRQPAHPRAPGTSCSAACTSSPTRARLLLLARACYCLLYCCAVSPVAHAYCCASPPAHVNLLLPALLHAPARPPTCACCYLHAPTTACSVIAPYHLLHTPAAVCSAVAPVISPGPPALATYRAHRDHLRLLMKHL